MAPTHETYPFTVDMTIEVAKIFGFSDIVQLVEHLWGDVGALESASDVWPYLSVDIAKNLTNTIENEFARRFQGSSWSGDAKDAYKDWLSTFKSQTLDPIAQRANKVSNILTDASKKVRDIRHDLTLIAGSFLVAAGLAGYENLPSKGGHAKPPGVGRHAKPGATASIQIWIILVALAILSKELWDFYHKTSVEMKSFETALEKLESDHVVGDAAGIMPMFPTLTVADPREWRG